MIKHTQWDHTADVQQPTPCTLCESVFQPCDNTQAYVPSGCPFYSCCILFMVMNIGLWIHYQTHKWSAQDGGIKAWDFIQHLQWRMKRSTSAWCKKFWKGLQEMQAYRYNNVYSPKSQDMSLNCTTWVSGGCGTDLLEWCHMITGHTIYRLVNCSDITLLQKIVATIYYCHWHSK